MEADRFDDYRPRRGGECLGRRRQTLHRRHGRALVRKRRYGRKELVDAAARQLSLLPQYSYFTDFGNPPATELAAVIAKLTPGDLDHVFYSSSGSTANDTAIRIAHYYFDTIGKPSKRYVISRKNAYHGSTYLTAALSGKEGDRSGFKFPPGLVHHVSDANCYRMPEGIQDEGEYCDYLVDEFEYKIRSLGAGNIACFIAEPVMGAGGVLVAPEGYHRLMKNVCSENDILYISDEVVTGFGRLGHFFASHDRFDIVPDMIVVAKGITSGYIPLAATIVSEKVYEGLSRAQERRRHILARIHVFGPCRGLRGRARKHQHHRAGSDLRKGSEDRALLDRETAGNFGVTKLSAMCAAVTSWPVSNS